MLKRKILIVFVIFACLISGCKKDDNATKENVDNYTVLDAKVSEIEEKDGFFLLSQEGEDKSLVFTIKNGKNYVISAVDLYDSFLDKTYSINEDDENIELYISNYYHNEYKVLVSKIVINLGKTHELSFDKNRYYYSLEKIYYWDSDSQKNESISVKKDNKINIAIDFEKVFSIGKYRYIYKEFSENEKGMMIYDASGYWNDYENLDVVVPETIQVKNYKDEIITYSISSIGEMFVSSVRYADKLIIPKTINRIEIDYSDDIEINEVHYAGKMKEFTNIYFDPDDFDGAVFYTEEGVVNEATYTITNDNMTKYTYMYDWQKLNKIIVDGSVERLEKSRTIRYVKSIVVEEGVSIVAGLIFYNNTDKLEYVILPSSLTHISNFLNFGSSSYGGNVVIYSNDTYNSDVYDSEFWSNYSYKSSTGKSIRVYWKGSWALDSNGEPYVI